MTTALIDGKYVSPLTGEGSKQIDAGPGLLSWFYGLNANPSVTYYGFLWDAANAGSLPSLPMHSPFVLSAGGYINSSAFPAFGAGTMAGLRYVNGLYVAFSLSPSVFSAVTTTDIQFTALCR